jgi:mono/diheme cytochrome c family protein
MKRMLASAVVCGFAAIASLVVWSSRDQTRAAPPDAAPTFSNEVVRVFQQNCQSCHNPGDIAPFSLMTYEEAVPFAESIKAKTQARQMPPWKAVAGCGEFENARALDDEDLDTIVRWVDAGVPEGDPAHLPPPLAFPDEWKNGEPDLALVTAAKGYKIPAGVTEDIYRCFTLPADTIADRFVTGVEIRPGNRAIVHHVLLFIDGTGASVALDRADPGPGYSMFGGVGFTPTGSLGGWAPGSAPQNLPEGTGVLVPRGARIVVQVHYKPNGLEEIDATQIGLKYARGPVYQDMFVLPVWNRTFTIPADARDYPVNASLTLPQAVNITLRAVAPHMHLLGREMQVTATLPDGERRCLIYIDDWDFHWQGQYDFAQPIPLPAGTRIDVAARYDNSELNHNQPSFPPIPVSWGERTTDEMCIAFIAFTVDAQRRVPSTPAVDAVRFVGSKLLVDGTELMAGAFIDVDGTVLRDTVVKKKRLVSKRDWEDLIPPGREVRISVLNPDGGRSEPVAFSR